MTKSFDASPASVATSQRDVSAGIAAADACGDDRQTIATTA